MIDYSGSVLYYRDNSQMSRDSSLVGSEVLIDNLVVTNNY